MLGLSDAQTQSILDLETGPVFERHDVAKKQAARPASKIVPS
jgi:hypothetical protein